ncbi:solute carrier family 13 member 5 [Elysia marginata]|uniref:Solute carrier family 13 member 5 n=1 Tax=Elysia marginata TaxID=1093978 RepID=A0AAV4EJ77_9GAST|nr:solute carrier family 13 member 5 [Elysia marginata]
MALGRSRWWRGLCAWRNYIILLVTPLVCAPMLTIGTPESRCAYPVMLMAVYWFTEAMPVGVTALLPVVLFPLLDVVKSSDISRLYMTMALYQNHTQSCLG